MIRFRQWIALTLCAVMVMCLPAASAENVDALSVLSQMDMRLRNDAYMYRNSEFRFGGCGPSSVTNALIGTLNITDHELAASLLYDVMHFMSPKPARQDIDPIRLRELNNQERLERFPVLAGLLEAYQGNIQPAPRRFDADDVRQALNAGSPALFISQTTLEDDDWNWVRDVVEVLYSMGCHDARLCFGLLAGGTNTTTGPFRSGASGHYISLCIPVDEFHESGTVYLFDSLPRSLENEDYETDERFFAAYAFNTNLSRNRELKSQWDITRVSDTVLKISPMGGKPDDWETSRYQLSLLQVYDTGVAFLAFSPQSIRAQTNFNP